MLRNFSVSESNRTLVNSKGVHIRYIVASESVKSTTNGASAESTVSSVQGLKLQNETWCNFFLVKTFFFLFADENDKCS